MNNKLEVIDAVKRADLTSLRTLIQSKELIEQKDDYGWTALNWAAGKGELEAVQLLLEHDANVFQAGRDQRTPYQIALAAGPLEVSRMLVDAASKASGGGSAPKREYCRAYNVSRFTEFPGWREGQTQAAAHGSSENGNGSTGAGSDAEEEEIAFLHSDYTVTRSMWHDEDVIFSDVTNEWREFCTNVLEFMAPSDLDLIVQS
jgi:ankyrin repeat protein